MLVMKEVIWTYSQTSLLPEFEGEMSRQILLIGTDLEIPRVRSGYDRCVFVV
jgi:hypothetical protein